MPTQTQSGKAFEYTLINEANNLLSTKFTVYLVKDANYENCLSSFNIHTSKQQQRYSLAAIAALHHIISLEPRLVNPTNTNDILTLQLQPDTAGQQGDVRDVLFIRSSQNWDIGISAKNNHKALKHSRLSNVKDFGQSWVDVPCSDNYFKTIAPIFEQLAALRSKGELWRNIPNKHEQFYIPILKAFCDELLAINAANPDIPQKLISYLIGRHDFYKVMKRARTVEIMAFNLHGTLGKNIGSIRSASPIPKLALPTQIIQFQMQEGSKDTLSMISNQGWQLSFRIHNAESLVVASLKFDVNLVGNPNSMYTNHISY